MKAQLHVDCKKVKGKGKLSQCLTKHHAMKAYWGWRYSATHSWPWH